MNRLHVWGMALVFGGLALGLRAQPHLALRPRSISAPPHPTALVADYKGAIRAIVGVAGAIPQVMVDDKLKRLPAKQSYLPLRAKGYLEGYISLSHQEAHSEKTNLVYMFSGGGEVSGGTIKAASYYSATLTVDQDLPDVYVAVLFFDAGFVQGDVDTPSATIAFHHIGDLKGGVAKKVTVQFGYLDGSRRLNYFPLFFSRGFEVRSDVSDQASRFFHRTETLMHKRLVETYLTKNVGANRQAAAYVQMAPIFPEDIDYSALPEQVPVSFMVNDEGRVEGLEIPRGLPPEVEAPLRATINGWLFYPRLKEGHPDRAMVTIPISFGQKKAEAK